jgi:hypothetical protein
VPNAYQKACGCHTMCVTQQRKQMQQQHAAIYDSLPCADLWDCSAAGVLCCAHSSHCALMSKLRTPQHICVICVSCARLQAAPVAFPQLLPLCGLDALCISAITTKLMDEFDAGGGWGWGCVWRGGGLGVGRRLVSAEAVHAHPCMLTRMCLARMRCTYQP